ncbi:MAG: FoF1 ATP synthase subunit gamma [Eubacteriales bacterium]|nr:FoF1 ATP synthase subunit gamma [Eubacteriales bacterium]
MASKNDMKRRMKSIRDLRQMTRAMQLISQIKRGKAMRLLDKSKPFYVYTMRTMNEIMIQSPNLFDPLFQRRKKAAGSTWKIRIILVPAEEGMAAAYSLKVLRHAEKLADELLEHVRAQGYDAEVRFQSLGRSMAHRLAEDGYLSLEDIPCEKKEPDYYFSHDLASQILGDYHHEVFDEVYFVYMHMNTKVSSDPFYIRMFPADALGLRLLTKKMLSAEELEYENAYISKLKHRRLDFEPNELEVIKYLESAYATAMLYGILNEAYAAEQTFRMQSMDSATTNADELLEDLQALMNQTRQAEITEELNEIIAGASSLDQH